MTPKAGRAILLTLSLLGATLAAFSPVLRAQFVNYDDNVYVYQNRHIKEGLTLDGVRWAFASLEESNWHPLTWMSHMLDASLFGLNPNGHHLTSLVLHLANTLLLLRVLRGMTGALGRSALAAGLFALHPLHVEAVAWVAERKEVLSAFFWMLTLLAYLRYVRRPGAARYLPVVVALAMALMSKPMAVTLPFTLLLLDLWPLGRMRPLPPPGAWGGGTLWRRFDYGRLLLEKMPLFVLVAVSSYVTLLVQRRGGAVIGAAHYPFPVKVGNALTSYLEYVWQTVWPSDLTAIHPHPGMHVPLWEVSLGAVFFVAVTVVSFLVARRRPSLGLGWLWFAGTLVPVIGLIQVGIQARADRYTYIPLIGLFIIVVWGAADILAEMKLPRAVPPLLALVLLGSLAAATRSQAALWRSGIELFGHAVEVTPGSWKAHHNYGVALADAGRLDEAIFHYRRSLEITPFAPEVHYSLGNALARQRKFNEAVASYAQVVAMTPGDAEAHNNLGAALADSGRCEESIPQFTEAMRLDPQLQAARANLDRCLAILGNRPRK